MDDLLFYFETKIPSFVFLLSFFAMAIVIVLTLANRRLRSNGKVIILSSLLTEYYFLTLCSTVIYRGKAEVARLELVPFWNYPLIASWKDPRDFWEVILNIVLFMPIGFLAAGMSKQVRWYQVLLLGICMSSTIETLQYFLHRGLCETNDVIHNTIGCMIGYWVYRLIENPVKMFRNRKLIAEI